MFRVLIVTQDDPFYVTLFFKELLKNQSSIKFDLVGVVIQPPLGKKSIFKLIRQLFNFYGIGNFIVLGFKYLIYRIMNIIAIEILKGKFPGSFSVKHILLKNNIKVYDLKNINSKKSIDFLKGLKLDVIFSVAASQIFKDEVLMVPRLGCFNIHTSKLPKNRGMMPNFWSLLNYDKDPTSAVTIHKMNQKLDDGEILIQREFVLNPNESLDKLIRKTKLLSVECFLESMKILQSGNFALSFNDSKFATYNTFPNISDVKSFKKKGFRLL